MNETLIFPWKPTPTDEKYKISFDLINRINFLLQYIVKEQLFIDEILNMSPQPASEIIKLMGSDGELWLKANTIINDCVTQLSNVGGKTLADIGADQIIKTTENIELVGDGTIIFKPIIKEEPSPIESKL